MDLNAQIHPFAGREWLQTGNNGGAVLRHVLGAGLPDGEDFSLRLSRRGVKHTDV